MKPSSDPATARTRVANRKDHTRGGGWRYRMLWTREGAVHWLEREFTPDEVRALSRPYIADVLRAARARRNLA